MICQSDSLKSPWAKEKKRKEKKKRKYIFKKNLAKQFCPKPFQNNNNLKYAKHYKHPLSVLPQYALKSKKTGHILILQAHCQTLPSTLPAYYLKFPE